MKESAAKQLVDSVIKEMIFTNPIFNWQDVQNECVNAINQALDKVEFIEHFQIEKP